MLSMAARLLVRDPRRFSKSYDLAIADARAALESAKPFFCWNRPRGKLEYTIVKSNNPYSNDPSIGPCPVCGGPVNERKQSCSCGNWRQGCRFAIWRVITKKEIDRDIAICLLQDKTSAVIDGFKSKAGKDFPACLEILNDEVKFHFE